MPPTDHELAITAATSRLDLAEGELTKAIGALTSTERSDKQMVTERLQLALAEIGAAKANLATCLKPPTD
jgi:hypothetical protein